MHKSNGRYLSGFLIIGVGIIALLNNFGLAHISFSYLLNLLWPLLLVIAGINFIVNRRNLNGIVMGGILVGLGVVFLGRNAGFFDFDMRYFWQGFWPMIIILIGVSLFNKDDHNSAGHLALMGALEKSKEGWEIKNAEYTAIMGGIELDIRKASFSDRQVTLGLTAIMGAITVIIPEDAAVSCQGTAILGGIDLLGRGTGGIVGNINTEIGDLQNAAKVIHLNCTCIMGGIEIKH